MIGKLIGRRRPFLGEIVEDEAERERARWPLAKHVAWERARAENRREHALWRRVARYLRAVWR